MTRSGHRLKCYWIGNTFMFQWKSMTPSSPSLCWVEVPDHGASVSVKCRHHKTVPSSHHPTWYQGYHRYLDISIYLHSDTRHLSAEPPCHNPLSRVTCHAGADADSARVIMNLSSGSCLNAPLAPALPFQCWYLQLRDWDNLKVQLFWSVRSPGWAAAALCRLWLDIYDPRPVRGTLTMRPPSQLWPAQHGGPSILTLVCILVCRKHINL